MSGEEREIKTEEKICEMSMESLLLMMNLSEDDFIINITLSEEDGDDDG